MELIVANVDSMKFDIEIALEEQFGALPLPFPGMDKSTSAVCTFYPKGSCSRGPACPFRHVRTDRSVVCKHWLRGLCKKGDQCEFLHEFDMTKMPECYFYSRFNACHNKECPFLHIDPESKIKDCPWYDRGFCRHGPLCRHRHVRRVLCSSYLAGFCPDGPNCKFMHPRFELPAPTDQATKDASGKQRSQLTCHFCGESGHKALYCHKMPPELRSEQQQLQLQHQQHYQQQQQQPQGQGQDAQKSDTPTAPAGQPRGPGEHGPRYPFPPRHPLRFLGTDGEGHPPHRNLKPLEEVTCFKCGCKGHYANKCPKGHLAFLSQHSGRGGMGNFQR